MRAAHSPSKAAAERRAEKLRLELQETEAALAAARDHVQQLTQGLDASNDVIQASLHWRHKQRICQIAGRRANVLAVEISGQGNDRSKMIVLSQDR